MTEAATPNESAPVTETKAPDTATPAAPEGEKKDFLAPKFAALAKKEKIARQQLAAAKAREAELAKREAAIAAREREWDEEFKRSPLDAIKKRGYTYQDLTNAALNDGKFAPETEIKDVKAEIARLREEQAEKERLASESAQKQAQAEAQAAVEEFKERITEHVTANKDKYELVNLYDAAELVFQTVEEHFERTKAAGKPKILSIDEACALVEGYIESELDRTAQNSKKFQSKYAAAKAAEAEKEKSGAKSSTTLSNNLSSSAAPSLLPAKTENDRIARALAKLG